MSHLLLLARVVALVAAAVIAARLALRSNRHGQITVQVRGERMLVELRRWDLLWVGRRRIAVPLHAVQAVCVRTVQPVSGLPIMGSVLPGGLRMGTFLVDGEREFWHLRGAGQALIVELGSVAPWSRLVLQVADPQQAALALRPHARTLVPAWL